MAVKDKQEMDWLASVRQEAEQENTPVEVPLTNVYGEPYLDKDGNPAVAFVLGVHSKAVRNYDLTADAPEETGDPDTDRDNRERAHIRRVVAATAGWRLALGGKEVPFSPENAEALYSASTWVLNTVWLAVAARARFFGAKSTS